LAVDVHTAPRAVDNGPTATRLSTGQEQVADVLAGQDTMQRWALARRRILVKSIAKTQRGKVQALLLSGTGARNECSRTREGLCADALQIVPALLAGGSGSSAGSDNESGRVGRVSRATG
jgi:hypothetical protein